MSKWCLSIAIFQQRVKNRILATFNIDFKHIDRTTSVTELALNGGERFAQQLRSSEVANVQRPVDSRQTVASVKCGVQRGYFGDDFRRVRRLARIKHVHLAVRQCLAQCLIKNNVVINTKTVIHTTRVLFQMLFSKRIVLIF